MENDSEQGPSVEVSHSLPENHQDYDLSVLENAGITVWSKTQDILEQQALKELEIFTNKPEDQTEDGEIIEESDTVSSDQRKDILDINAYIKKQDELRRIQECKKTLQECNESKEVTESVPQQCSKTLQKKRKAHVEKHSKKAKKSKDKDSSNEEHYSSGSEYFPSEADSDYVPDEEGLLEEDKKQKKQPRKRSNCERDIRKVTDDGLIQHYEKRLEKYYKELEQKDNSAMDDVEENAATFHSLKGGLKVPKKIWDGLYRYQKDGVKWLWEINQKGTGGILGDEMGLGKTVQIIAFLAALDSSKIVSSQCRFTGLGPTIIVCPATVIHQWVQHFHEWIPEFRVAVLHQSGCYPGNKINLIREIHKCKSILITTYIGVLKYIGELSNLNWHYVILDEGHKIRNATTKVTVAVKRLKTPYRLLLTGSPMQNNLQELWSLFDFTNPGMLGTSQTFVEHFVNPIIHGGFINATPMQEATALSMATALKNMITPYLLRRSKNEVQDDILLPSKSEQVLFCSLTDIQKQLYKEYLLSEQVNVILGKGSKNWYPHFQIRTNMLIAITTLRKICNHPDLYIYDDDELAKQDEGESAEEQIGYYKKSGKMVVVSALLKIWRKQGHRVLLFTQGRAMMNVFEKFLSQQNYKYLKMNGSTSISSRQPLIEKFNRDESQFVFLLTTRVGGLGVNLTGANRVIIFDPDWNPATDTQARERAWRIGQNRQVTIYRLLSAGTIEEKMYQRQVWKQLLSNKVLLDPRTNRFFRSSDLHDLFSLQEQTDNVNPETTNIFRDSRVKLQEKIKEDEEKKKESKRQKKMKKLLEKNGDDNSKVEFSEEKLKAMRELAQQISKSLACKPEDKPVIIKTPYQKEIEEERLEKLKGKEKLKELSPLELMIYNRKKAEMKEDTTNKINDHKTSISFDKALDISAKTAEVYHDLKIKKIRLSESHSDTDHNTIYSDSDNKNGSASTNSNHIGSDVKVKKLKKKRDPTNMVDIDSDHSNEATSIRENTEQGQVDSKKEKNRKKSKHKDKEKYKIDRSGVIDGEQVDGLVKTEIKKAKKEKHDKSKSQNDFVLEKLFSKKGVSGVLQHESVIQGSIPQNMRIETEAQKRTDKALQALRKSRIDNWRW